MKTYRILAAAAVIAALAACNTKTDEAQADADAVENEIKSEKPVNPKDLLPKKALTDSASYFMGLNFGMSVKQYDMGNLNWSLLLKGLKDAANSKGDFRDSAFIYQFKYNPGEQFSTFNQTLDKYIRMRRDYKLAVNKEKEEKFLAENLKAEGVQVTESGLQYIIEEAGSELKPGPKDTVYVFYKGQTPDGKVFDETKGEEPVRMLMNRVVKGWTEGLQLIGEGGKIKLFIPSSLGYGERGNSGIEPNTPLCFDVTLQSVKPFVEKPAEPAKPAKKK
ncbi:MAG: FKBP-type peptidyl-prolyl cis-trans isomerase [Bacteroidales bacterium]|nr:FKBP-type peptidyl-prolyl cis-trans isomerase [Bacteroidales bacterium]MBR6246420.1 FKBP-type peptidyl-prolyl cis-trans isomerase [Bacteroidales bacterium]